RKTNPDLSAMLNAWPYKPGQINARFVQGDDGEPRIQVRIDLGILQMYATGRPDGERPEGHDSLLEYFESRADEATAAGEEPARLSLDECRALRDELIQYYHRYV